ncbi:hypothetical protein ACIBBD_25185 [Streptomyces sp. NPDC051315]|uniref:hypothetical protein n=1 Tax=Streptomyces sp. NPDC051315 TaxID=3365650 RepID=UPI00379E7C8E
MCNTPVPCSPGRSSTTLLLCDTTTTTPVAPTVVDDTVTTLGPGRIFPDLPGSHAALWSGGALTYPADPNGSAGDGTQVYRTAVGRITATPPNCEGATGTLTVSTRVTLNGPGRGELGDGALWLYRNTTMIAEDSVMRSAPVGHVETLTVSAPITAADLAGGNLYVALNLETFHATSKSWTADQFSITAQLNGCAVQFLRTFVMECTYSDTTLDGRPYTPTGEVGQCSAPDDSSVQALSFETA